MADGPCGEEFKAAFSCFVYSKEDPKGMDCVDKFQYVAWPEAGKDHERPLTSPRHMQDCFRKYPEIYGSELDDDESAEGAPAAEGDEALVKKEDAPRTVGAAATPAEIAQEKIPKKATDATEANKGKAQ